MDNIKIGNSPTPPPSQRKPGEAIKVGGSDGKDRLPDESGEKTVLIKAQQQLELEVRKPEEQEARKTQVNQAVERLNDYVQSVQRELHFEIDEGSGRSVIKVIDQNTNKVIRQIPEEHALELARNLSEEGALSLLKTKV